MVSENILLDINIRLGGVALLGMRGKASTKRSTCITNLLRTNTAHFIVGIMPFYGQGSVYRSMLYFRRGLQSPTCNFDYNNLQTNRRSKSGMPDNLSSHGIIYSVAYLVHNRQKMQPSKFKFRMKFHIL